MKPAYRLPSRPVADPGAVVAGDTWRITLLTDGLVRLEHAADGVFEDRASTFALHRRLPVPEHRVEDRGDHLVVTTARFTLTYDKGPFSTSGLSVAVGGGVSSYHSVWRHGQPRDDLGGTARTLDGVDGAVPLEAGVVSRHGFAVIDDSASPLLDDEGWVAPRAGDRQDLYVFAYGRDHEEAVRALHLVSGPAPVVPRWALGTWWSRYHRYTEESYRAVVERFRAEGVPLSVSVIDMDWHLVDVDPVHGSGWTGYTWNRELFPDPERFLSWLHEQGLRVTLNVHPADGVRSYEDAYPAMTQALGRDPDEGLPIAFDVTDRRFLEAYLEVLHRGLEAQGVDFWWLDWQSGPYSRVAGVDPLWMLNHFHYLDSAREGRRGLTFSRYAGPGSHRYPVGFSGDTVISWASLDAQPHFTATAANIGYGWWSHDIGGHFFGARDDELTARWVELGTFSPILRLHSGANPFITKEPWAFPGEAGATMTAHLRLRHRLVPYLHTMNHRAAQESVPLVRPVHHGWPRREEAYAVPNAFLFGSQLLVAPVTQPADPASRLGRTRAWLPEGTWLDLVGGLVYDGDRTLDLHRPLGAVPVLARAGAVVPLDGAAVPGNDPVNPEHLELVVVVGADGRFDLLEDDGTADGATVRTPVRLAQAPGELRVGPATGPLAAVPALRRWTVSFAGLDVGAADDDAALAGRVRVSVDGRAVAATVRRSDAVGLASGLPAGACGGLVVDVDEPVAAGAALLVELGPEPALGGVDVAARAFAVLDRAHASHQGKARAWDAVRSARPLGTRVAELGTLDLPASVVDAVTEVLLART
ncbi:TIM-barrel domain-containing protein [Cellulomonas endophytica]|uniref:glycoside hydrolase family 31 protein n=1 Tax=Cellulomonas endophytica TaxID=2494735 RepID=UPI001011F15E|nr:TIM-barrel domain-containing protein [Cellulomonas endophytica]